MGQNLPNSKPLEMDTTVRVEPFDPVFEAVLNIGTLGGSS